MRSPSGPNARVNPEQPAVAGDLATRAALRAPPDRVAATPPRFPSTLFLPRPRFFSLGVLFLPSVKLREEKTQPRSGRGMPIKRDTEVGGAADREHSLCFSWKCVCVYVCARQAERGLRWQDIPEKQRCLSQSPPHPGARKPAHNTARQRTTSQSQFSLPTTWV